MDKNICSSTFTVPLIPNKAFEDHIKPYCVIKQCPKGFKFLEAGDSLSGIYYIKTGRTRHYFIAEDGEEKVLYTLSSGWIFGETPIVLNEPTGLISETMETSEIWFLPSSKYNKLINEDHPVVRTYIMKNLCRKIRILRHDIEMLVFYPVKERILQLFCSTANTSELIDGNWYGLYNKYTHYEISTIIGSARVTTSKLINELSLEGYIRIVNHKIQVSKEAYEHMMD